MNNKAANYSIFTSWFDSNEDDHIIAEYLRKKILKETYSLLIFYFICLLTSLMILLYSSMVLESLPVSIIGFLLAIGSATLVSSAFQYISKRGKQIDSRGFKTCAVDAYEISDKYEDKYCLIKDKEGHSLTEPFSYHSYFSHKETDGILVVLPSIEKNKSDFCIVLPRSFIACEKQEKQTKNVKK